MFYFISTCPDRRKQSLSLNQIFFLNKYMFMFYLVTYQIKKVILACSHLLWWLKLLWCFILFISCKGTPLNLPQTAVHWCYHFTLCSASMDFQYCWSNCINVSHWSPSFLSTTVRYIQHIISFPTTARMVCFEGLPCLRSMSKCSTNFIGESEIDFHSA